MNISVISEGAETPGAECQKNRNKMRFFDRFGISIKYCEEGLTEHVLRPRRCRRCRDMAPLPIPERARRCILSAKRDAHA
jgi:hypothetical protein